jgi:hypothetical protein
MTNGAHPKKYQAAQAAPSKPKPDKRAEATQVKRQRTEK